MWLRISRPGRPARCTPGSTASRWRFVRHLAFPAPDGVRAGFLVQSPTGDGATARFDEIAFVPERLSDLRSGV